MARAKKNTHRHKCRQVSPPAQNPNRDFVFLFLGCGPSKQTCLQAQGPSSRPAHSNPTTFCCTKLHFHSCSSYRLCNFPLVIVSFGSLVMLLPAIATAHLAPWRSTLDNALDVNIKASHWLAIVIAHAVLASSNASKSPMHWCAA